MDNNIFNRFSRLLASERLAFKKKAQIFSFFLGLAIIIWFVNALNKTYTTEIDYPIRFKNYPENKTLIGDLPSELNLRVSALGYTILRNKISSHYIPIVFNVKSFTLNQLSSKDSSFYFIESRYIFEYISKQLDPEFEIISIKPDTLLFPFAKVLSKKILVKNKVLYELDKQLIFKEDLKIVPDSISITGPDYMLDTLTEVYTKEVDFGLITASEKRSVDLEEIKYIRFQEESVSLEFDIEKYTEKVLDVPVFPLNVPDSIRILTFPRKIKLSCLVGLSNFDFLRSDMFTLSVDYNSIVTGVSRIQVDLTNQPAYVQGVKYNPKTVEFLIEK